ncbi:hypothetical protein U27_00517 [Candidatus Vecturithrix granuli]|uniref:Uncharacterized protein n=1 Tax=Vecturithrix granuli TaxID=1499967 RepID=A0A081C7R5_VECG1|nr:hypothetical protein U27_00517 [Candidatus Vecturithrix granuli]
MFELRSVKAHLWRSKHSCFSFQFNLHIPQYIVVLQYLVEDCVNLEERARVLVASNLL